VRDLDRTRALLARADERVRREAAEVLHGRVQSRLLASQVRLERAAQIMATDPGLAERELSDVVSVLDDLRVNDVRFTSHQLHPPTIRISLLSALRSLIATFEGSFAVDVELHTAPEVVDLDDPAEGRLDEATRLVLYRVLEEALQNAYKHGHATEVSVDLASLPGGRLQMRVIDNGVGFAPESFTIGLGVASMAARVEDHAGAWWISSNPGSGTTLTAIVPIPAVAVKSSSTSGGAMGGGERNHATAAVVAEPPAQRVNR
jgi:signal transduction histidine kinase